MILKWVAYYSISMGILQAGTWGVLTLNGSVAADLADKPVETSLLLLAELLTAGGVIAGGSSILAGRKWGVPLCLTALGMMLYCVIFSCGVFGQLGVWPALAWFVIVTILTSVCIFILLAPMFSKRESVSK